MNPTPTVGGGAGLAALADELAKLPPDEIEYRCNLLQDRVSDLLEQRHPEVFAKMVKKSWEASRLGFWRQR